ncbi:fluoride efflux transporter CrcB [Candidatus Berkiella cookevillensis]|uniref:Fluoride-specific ion channel FluC n=1 Tax=Candidatus Berkiella cookevillensis TaxID=437022 RepID=A0A0Q9YKV6_9GAMM|nr:fluoride efflux transporter CrcB [Candidatus Berkiella cookevillensis]MCS5707398.1 fluoride efflux transporter CrcB [Candidatus Berkiella cookevillensis]
MNHSLLIFIGAGIGGVLRYWVSSTTHHWTGKSFPLGTLLVNVSGCLLIGFLFILILNRFHSLSLILRPLLLVGFLGGYTTFSAFSIETLHLFEQGAWSFGLINIILNTLLCLLAVWLGAFAARMF